MLLPPHQLDLEPAWLHLKLLKSPESKGAAVRVALKQVLVPLVEVVVVPFPLNGGVVVPFPPLIGGVVVPPLGGTVMVMVE